jgi:hypothetical protein
MCTTAAGWQPYCSYMYSISYHIIPYNILYINISYVVIFVDVIGKVIHRKWEAAKLLDVCMIILIIFCMIQPSVVFCWCEYFMLHLKN